MHARRWLYVLLLLLFAPASFAVVSVGVSVVDAPDPIDRGELLTYTITLDTNASDEPAGHLALFMNYPAGTTFQSLAAPPAFTCVNQTVELHCVASNFPADQTATFTVTLLVEPDVAAGTVLTTTTRTEVNFLPHGTPVQTQTTVSALPVITFLPGPMMVTEGDSGNTPLVFTLVLDQPALSEVRVDYDTFGGFGATANQDFVDTAGTAVFAPGQTQTTVTVQVIGDTLTERTNPPEAVVLRLTNPVNASIGEPEREGFIHEDDPPQTLEVSGLTAPESAGFMTLVFSTPARAEEPRTYTATIEPGTATPGADYVAPAPFTFTFDADTQTHTVQIPLIQDNLTEGNETFIVSVTWDTPGGPAEFFRTATITDAAAPGPEPVPTLSEWMLIALAGLLALAAAVRLR
ncbi:MAG TPA: IPTL-CTERM sorting domain-containing protein [Thermoanaerobaculia bacterium]